MYRNGVTHPVSFGATPLFRGDYLKFPSKKRGGRIADGVCTSLQKWVSEVIHNVARGHNQMELLLLVSKKLC